jgi:hypothetical protein
MKKTKKTKKFQTKRELTPKDILQVAAETEDSYYAIQGQMTGGCLTSLNQKAPLTKHKSCGKKRTS